ncbi:MAG: hypothetical protein ACLQPD_03955 [Desulfomonilaceae bacterium]
MNHIDSREWKLSVAVKKCFSDADHHIAISTVQSWMREKIFIPYKKAAARSSTGSRVIISDLTFLSLLSILFWLGIRFTLFQPGGTMKATGWQGITAIEKKGETAILFANHMLKPEEKVLLSREISLRQRPVQQYLETESINYNARIWIRTYTGDSVKRFITFFPSSESSEVTKILAHNDDGWGVDTIINIRPHLEYVKGKMDTN